MVDLSVEPYRVPTLIGGLAMLGLAVWLFALSPGSRVHRAFALFFALRGSLSLLIASNDFVDSPEGRVGNYLTIALPFAALHLANQAWLGRGDADPRSWLRSPFVSWGLLGAALFLEILYFFDHDLVVRPQGAGFANGPLGYGLEALHVGYGLLAFVFALAWTRSSLESPARRRALFDLSLAFAMIGAQAGAFYTLVIIGAWSDLGTLTSSIGTTLYGVGLALVGAALALVFARARRGHRTDAVRFAVVTGLAIGSGVLVYVLMLFQRPGWTVAGVPAWLFLFTGVGNAWHLLLAWLVAFAIVRYRFIDLEVRVRWTISRGVVASALVAAFFIFSEATSQYLGQRLSQNEAFADAGSYMGIAAVGLLLFMLSPLHKLGEKVGAAAMPDAVPLSKRSVRERLALYAEQTRIAWEDGSLTAKERRLLDHVRRRLGLTDQQAAKLEADVLAEILPDPRRARELPAGPQRARRQPGLR